jgi:hypothetical protein
MALKNPYLSNQYDERLTSTSVFPHDKQLFDVNMDLSNQITQTNDVENNNKNRDKNSFYHISSDVNTSLLNQESNKSLSTSSDILTNVNHDYNESFVSHIPMMSSSNSSSSIPTLNEQLKSQPENDLRTRPIVVGQETLIEIDRETSGLGLSVVGGSDTQLVNQDSFKNL